MSGLNRSRGTMAVSSGKWYYEVWMKYQHHGSNAFGIREVGGNAIIANDTNANFINVGHPVGSGVQYNLSVNGSQSTGGEVGSVSDGDIIGVMFDVDAQTISFKSNNSEIHSSLTNLDYSACSNMETVAPFISVGGGRDAIVNFGQDSSFAGFKTSQGNQDGNDIGDFYYTPPSGFLALCTSNLPDATVVPSENFNTVLYTGNESGQSIDVGFQPDWVWMKSRSEAHGNAVIDSVRGVNANWLYTNTADDEFSEEDNQISFDSDGFNLLTGYNISNDSGQSYVAWNWKANGSGSSNTNGDITSTVSANVDSGFSIVGWSGTGSAATIGHGLSKKPEMIMVKRRNANEMGWRVFHDANAANYHLVLDTTGARASSSSIFNNTEPTASLFTVGSGGSVNNSSGTYIAYCFHSVDGYSKVGSYVGNGRTGATGQGPFVNLGFRPAYIMIKRSSSSSAYTNWVIYDSKRDGFNQNAENSGGNKYVYADSSSAEANTYILNTFSNGFTIYDNYDVFNSSGQTYIYLAFAETPFKYSNAR